MSAVHDGIDYRDACISDYVEPAHSHGKAKWLLQDAHFTGHLSFLKAHQRMAARMNAVVAEWEVVRGTNLA